MYTIPALRQVILYSTQDDFPIPIEQSIEGWFDPLREPLVGQYLGYEEAEEAIHGHRTASRRAFATARVLIITLGQNEGWIDRRSGLVWARRPRLGLEHRLDIHERVAALFSLDRAATELSALYQTLFLV